MSARSFFVLTLAVWVAVVVLRLWPLHGRVLSWDEVDYAIAARSGVVANATDRGGMPLADFFRYAKAKADGTSRIPAGYDERADLLVRRHYHPPLVVSMVSLAHRLPGLTDERRVRAVQILGALLLMGTAAASYLRLAEADAGPGGIATVALAGWASVLLFGGLSFHGWQAVWISMCCLILAGPWVDSRPVRRGVAIGIPLALCLVTLETGTLVAVTVLLGLFVLGRRAPGPAGHLTRTIGTASAVAVAGLLLLWPAALVKLSYLRIAALYAFRIMTGDEYARVPMLALEIGRSLAPLLGAGALALAYAIRANRLLLARWALPTLLTLAYTAALMPFTLSPEYLLPGLCPLLPLVGAAVDAAARGLPRRWHSGWVVAAASVVLVASTAARSQDGERDDLQWLGGEIAGRSVLADGGHVYSYYLPGYDISPLEVSYDGRRLLRREGGRYTRLAPADLAGKMVIVRARRDAFYRNGEAEYFPTCTRVIRATLRLYDCRSRP